MFPCGKARCDKFQPHLWKPKTCVTCFKTKTEKTEQGVKTRSERWERKYKDQWEMLSESLLSCAIVENAMVEPAGSEMVTHLSFFRQLL